jgi:uncharacterized protein (TIGR03086 family)
MTITENPTTTGTHKGGPPAAGDPRAVFARAVGLGTDVIGAVRPEQLDGATPCPDYDGRALLAHMVTVLHRVAALGRGDDPFALPPVDPGMAADEWLAAWSDAAHDVQAAWTDDAVLTRTMRLPWAESSGAGMLVSYLSEITVHTWDLATATGQRPAWDPEVLGLAYDASRFMPGQGRTAMFQAVKATMPPELRDAPDPFADAVPVPDDAPLIDRLVAWNGRRPQPC